MIDVEIDERITALEEIGGGENTVNGKKIDAKSIRYLLCIYERINCFHFGHSSFSINKFSMWAKLSYIWIASY